MKSQKVEKREREREKVGVGKIRKLTEESLFFGVCSLSLKKAERKSKNI